MKKNAKKILSLAITLLMAAITMIACGPSSTPTSGANSGKVTLTFWNGFTASDGEVLKSIVDKYNADNKDTVEIKMDIMPWANFNEKLPSSIATNSGPSFVLMNLGDTANYIQNGAILPLDDFFSETGMNKDDFDPASLATFNLDGKQWLIPMQMNTRYLYYNKTIMKDAGLDPDKPPTTWDELEQMAIKMTDPSKNQFGFGIQDDFFVSTLIIRSNGGYTINPNGNKNELNSPQNIDSLKFVQKLMTADKVSPIATKGADMDNLMLAGKIGLYINGPWLNNGLRKNNIDYSVALLPAGKLGKSVNVIDAVGFALIKGADDKTKKAVYDFVKYWNSPEICKEWSTKNCFPPYIKATQNDSDIKNDPILSKMNNALDNAEPYYIGLTTAAKIDNDALTPLFDNICNGADVEKSVADTSKQIDDILKGN